MKNLLYVYKSMGIILQNEWRNRAIFVAIIIMLSGLFLSRAILSVSMGLFLSLTLLHRGILSQIRRFSQSLFLAGLSFLFFIPLISGCWSENVSEWLKVMQDKLPFLLLPIAFAGVWQLSERQWRFITIVFIALVVTGSVWSLLQYALDYREITESYLRAKTLPTPLKDDHLRFSWLVSIALLLALKLFIGTSVRRKKMLLSVIMVFLLAYLHILSARSGLVMAYALLISFIAYQFFRSPVRILLLLSSLAITVTFCWYFIPSLQNRLRYIRYDQSFITRDNIVPGTSDANRTLSLQAGWTILKSHPWGVGAGDIRQEMDHWYTTHTPTIREEDKLFPSSEWMVHGNMAGWLGIILFTISVSIPFFVRNILYRFFFIMLQCMAVAASLVDTSLEIQYGIFIYCMPILCWWKSQQMQKE